jgi:hypothetical protein
MTTQPSKLKVVRLLYLDNPKLGQRYALPNLKHHGVDLELVPQVTLSGTYSEADLVILEHQREGVSKASKIAEELRPKTIVFWGYYIPGDEAPYAGLGLIHFCSEANLVGKMLEVLGLSTIKVTLKGMIEMVDFTQAENSQKVPIQPGTYELERIRNPYGYDGSCLTLKGTKIGMAEDAWTQHIASGGKLEVVMEENGQIMQRPK